MCVKPYKLHEARKIVAINFMCKISTLNQNKDTHIVTGPGDFSTGRSETTVITKDPRYSTPIGRTPARIIKDIAKNYVL